MNARLNKIGMGLALIALPLFASAANAQQWAQQPQISYQPSVSMSMGDTSPYQQAPLIGANHTISLNQNGTLSGRVASIDGSTKQATGLSGLNVFFIQNNQVRQQALTSADGSFVVQGLPEGPYTFIAAGKSGIAAYGVYVTRQNLGTGNLLEATTASTQFQGLQQLIQQNAPAVVAQSVNSAMQSVSQSTSTAPAKQIQLVSGRLNGRVSTVTNSQSVGNVQVHLIQDGKTIAQVETNPQGSFSIPDVQPGIYDFVAVGYKSFAATRFEAIGKSGPMTQVSYRRAIPQDMDVALTCPCNDTAVAQPMEMATGDVYMEPAYSAPVEYAGESIAYGGASGGTCGSTNSFGGFGGGGIVQGRFGGGGVFGAGGGRIAGLRGGLGGGAGIGRLLLLGGAAGGIVAIADPDDASPTN